MTTTSVRPIDALQAACGDRYAVEREIGAGGMATVYAATDTRHGRPVAIKVLLPELGHALGADRFLREIAIAARLQHPHILGLLDSGAANGLLYYVMPLIDGMSLRARLAREGELPLDDGIRLLQQVLDALAYAHGEGIVHRDIKPENVMLSGYTGRTGSRWHALVADFGVAKALSDAAPSSSLTATGMAMGTPAYMAPEQAAADPHVDHRADLYSFGVLAYEVLAGTPPFTGPSAQHVIAAHMTRTPAPISTHRPAVPAELDKLVLRCLEKRPSDRWRSAEEVLSRLEGLLTPSRGTASFAAARAEPIDRTFRLNERVCRTLDRSTLDPRVIGADLHYLDNGVRSNVLALMLTATGQDQELFRPVLASLPYRAIAPTYLGFEPVARQRPPLSVKNHIGIVRALLRHSIEESGATTVIVTGFSAGADVAMRLVLDDDGEPLPIDGLITLGCNLGLDTCWATRVFSRIRPGDESGLLNDLRTLSAGTTTVDDWVVSHEYFVNVLRRMSGDMEAVRRFSEDIVAPFLEDNEGTFPRWFRAASEKVRALRCVWEESATNVRLLQALRLRNLDLGVLGDRYRDDSIHIEAGIGHFDLLRPDVVRRHIDAVIDAARAGASSAHLPSRIG